MKLQSARMPKPVVFTYSKKKSQIDQQNSLFDRLIQDVSNNTIKKVRENNHADTNLSVFSIDTDMDDESPVKQKQVLKKKAISLSTTNFDVYKEPKKRKSEQNENVLIKVPTSQSKTRKKEPHSDVNQEEKKASASVGMSLRSRKQKAPTNEVTITPLMSTSQSFGLSSQLSDITLTKESPPSSKTLTKSVSLNDNRKSSADFGLSSTDEEEQEGDKRKSKIKLVKSSSDTATTTMSQQSPTKLMIGASPRTKLASASKFSLFSGGYAKKIPIKFNYDFYGLTQTSSSDHETQVSVETNENQSIGILTQTRKAYECEEQGEIQNLIDDTQYLMDGLDKQIELSQRCLSAIKLAEYCVNSDFRMHLRTHATLSKIFELLDDSPEDANLSLCTSCIMFTLSRDKLVMDLNESSFELMMKLLNKSLPSDEFIAENKLYKKNFNRCKAICDRFDELQDLNSHVLLVESLLSLTTTRVNGNWFKDSLRKHGTIDFLVDLLEKNTNILHILKYNRAFKLIECATNSNGLNQNYLCCMENERFFKLVKIILECLFREIKCKGLDESMRKSLSDVIRDIFIILMNLTHKNEFCVRIIGENQEIMNLVFQTLVEIIEFITENEQFDVTIMALGCFLNILDSHTGFRHEFERILTFNNNNNSIDFMIRLYNEKQTLVSKAEIDQEQEWNRLNTKITSDTTPNDDNLNVTLMNSIHQAGKHMEDHIIAANVAMILGYILLDNRHMASDIRCKLNDKCFENLILIIKKFLVFLKMMKINGIQSNGRIQEMLNLFQELNDT